MTRTDWKAKHRALRVELRELCSRTARHRGTCDINYGPQDAEDAKWDAQRCVELLGYFHGDGEEAARIASRRRCTLVRIAGKRRDNDLRAMWDQVSARVKALPATATREQRMAAFFKAQQETFA